MRTHPHALSGLGAQFRRFLSAAEWRDCGVRDTAATRALFGGEWQEARGKAGFSNLLRDLRREARSRFDEAGVPTNDVSKIERRYVVLASVPLMLEYESVLTRPEHLGAARISVSDIGVLLDALAIVAEPIRISDLWRPILSNPGDDLVLETAVHGRSIRLFRPSNERAGATPLFPRERLE